MSVFTAIAASSQPAGGAAPDSSAVVSGAGTAEVNGTYTPRGTNSGKPYYNLVGQPDNLIVASIAWQGAWVIWGLMGDGWYFSTDDTAFPWEAIFLEDNGDSPAPSVSEG